jgi:hypothetical protein
MMYLKDNFFSFRYLKDYDYYQKCVLEREKEERPPLKSLKRSRHNSGCLCFTGKSRRDSDKPLVSSVWRQNINVVREISNQGDTFFSIFFSWGVRTMHLATQVIGNVLMSKTRPTWLSIISIIQPVWRQFVFYISLFLLILVHYIYC